MTGNVSLFVSLLALTVVVVGVGHLEIKAGNFAGLDESPYSRGISRRLAEGAEEMDSDTSRILAEGNADFLDVHTPEQPNIPSGFTPMIGEFGRPHYAASGPFSKAEMKKGSLRHHKKHKRKPKTNHSPKSQFHSPPPPPDDPELIPHTKGHVRAGIGYGRSNTNGQFNSIAPAGNTNYNGGGVMDQPVSVKGTFYGQQWDVASMTLFENFVNSISDTSMSEQTTPPSINQWWNTLELYYDGAGNHVSSNVSWGGSVQLYSATFGDGQTSGPDVAAGLTQTTFQNIAAQVIKSNYFGPADENAIYVIFTSPDIKVKGLGTDFCGYHMTTSVSNMDCHLAIVPNAQNQACSTKPTCCMGGILSTQVSGGKFPNGNRALDSMIPILAHELAESVTDPDFDAWWSQADGNEIGDNCAWHFGKLYNDSQKAVFNALGSNGQMFMAQSIFNPATGQCTNNLHVPLGQCGLLYGGYPCDPGVYCQNGTCTDTPPNSPPPPPPKVPPPPVVSSPPPKHPSPPPPTLTPSPPSPSPCPSPPSPSLSSDSPPPPVVSVSNSASGHIEKVTHGAGAGTETGSGISHVAGVCGAEYDGFLYYPATDHPGADLAVYSHQNVTTCIAFCAVYPTCTGFVFSELLGSTCWLKTDLTSPVPSGVSETWEACQMHAPPLPTDPAKEVCDALLPGFQYFPSTDFVGGDITAYSNHTVDDCASLCNTTKECVAFSFAPTMRTCWLKSALAGEENSTYVDTYAVCGKGISIGMAPSNNGVCGAVISGYKEFPDTFQMGLDIASYTHQNETSCAGLCGTHVLGTCTGFVFSSSISGGACFLKSGLSDGVAFPGVDSWQQC